jgi:two-component system, NtrC family, sensor histidine kinase HydH
MKPSEQDNKLSQGIKSFRLVKFFTFSSILIMFIATIAISALNAQWARLTLFQKSEEYASALVANLTHQVVSRFMLPVILQYGEIRLREKDQFLLMDRVVRSTLHSFNVEMVTIYDENNTISYSFDGNRIGQENAGGIHYEKAMKNQTSSRLIQEGSFIKLLFWFPQQTKIITFSPLRLDKSISSNPSAKPVIGVVEIILDASDDYKMIFRLQGLIIASCFLIMGILFLVLRFVVKHGEKIIERRAEERLKLEEKLRQAEHLSAIGEMVAGISHEIRNPLGIINSSAQLLKKKMEKLSSKSTIPNIIIEESARLDNIISDFLNFAGPKSPDFLPCRIESIIDKNIAYLEPQIKENNLKIKQEISGKLPEIQADSSMLYQAFLNILINAFQALKQGGLITIRMRADNDKLIINFIDNGKGIQEENLKKVWTPFFTTKDTGTGLGLGIVKNIIEAHNGSIDISNVVPGGTDVEIMLPR